MKFEKALVVVAMALLGNGEGYPANEAVAVSYCS